MRKQNFLRLVAEQAKSEIERLKAKRRHRRLVVKIRNRVNELMPLQGQKHYVAICRSQLTSLDWTNKKDLATALFGASGNLVILSLDGSNFIPNEFPPKFGVSMSEMNLDGLEWILSLLELELLEFCK